jgi:hypothetical protein
MRWIHAVVFVVLFLGCSDSTAPEAGLAVPAPFAGNFDPSAQTFVLERAEVTVPGGVPIPVELVGSNLQTDSRTGRVTIDVALRNAGRLPLYAPASVRVGEFVPNTVRVTNSNLPMLDGPLDWWGFDYSLLLGSDDTLGPGETSDPWPWHFYDPGLESFSFRADVEMALEPPAAIISGGVFADENQNGIRERNEGPWPYGFMHLTLPDGTRTSAYCDDVGGFRFIVDQPGLYRLRLESLVDCIVCFTTPNPLEVMLVAGPDGTLDSFGMAIFGAICGACFETD